MVIPKINCVPSPTKAEVFLVERSIELLSSESIESYRLPLHNPKTLLIELNTVIKSFNSGELISEDYQLLVIEEARAMFKQPTYLKFGALSEEYFKDVLKKTDFMVIFYASNMLILDNANYANELFLKVKEVINEINQKTTVNPSDFDSLNNLIQFLLVELRQIGYSKVYLSKFITAIFLSNNAGSFDNRLKIIKNLISRRKEKFEVIIGFAIKPTIATQLQILDPSLEKIDADQIHAIIEKTNGRVKNYFHSHQDNSFYKVQIESFDYYSASNQVRKNLHLVLDVLFMGYSEEQFSINPSCVVIGSVSPNKAGIHNLNYQLDGYFRNDQKRYEEFSKRITSIRRKGINEALNKIESSLRYLRLGSDVKEVENKLINYWIGMEYFFSSSDSKQNKMTRMRKYFKKIHGKIYFKRLLQDLHRNIKTFSLQTIVNGYNDNLDYLSVEANYNAIEQNFISPLLAFRAHKLRNILFDRKNLIADLHRHSVKVEWNLVRIYRQRNSVVHSASGETNIIDITSHLRYYLIFSINSAVDYFNNTPFDINGDGKLNLEDYFLINQAEFDNLLMDTSLTATKILAIKNPIEFLA